MRKSRSVGPMCGWAGSSSGAWRIFWTCLGEGRGDGNKISGGGRAWKELSEEERWGGVAYEALNALADLSEGRRAAEEFCDEAADAPPVDRLARDRTEQHLGRHVLGRAAEAVRLGRRGHVAVAAGHLLGRAKVGELDVAVERDEHILRLQIAVHDVERVHVLEGEDDLACIAQCVVRVEGAAALKDGEDVAATDALHTKEEEGRVDVRELVRDDERARQRRDRLEGRLLARILPERVGVLLHERLIVALGDEELLLAVPLRQED